MKSGLCSARGIGSGNLCRRRSIFSASPSTTCSAPMASPYPILLVSTLTNVVEQIRYSQCSKSDASNTSNLAVNVSTARCRFWLGEYSCSRKLSELISCACSIAESPLLLARHFFSVALYAIWVQFTHPRPIKGASGKTVHTTARIDEYPHLLWKSVCVVRLYRL